MDIEKVRKEALEWYEVLLAPQLHWVCTPHYVNSEEGQEVLIQHLYSCIEGIVGDGWEVCTGEGDFVVLDATLLKTTFYIKEEK